MTTRKKLTHTELNQIFSDKGLSLKDVIILTQLYYFSFAGRKFFKSVKSLAKDCFCSPRTIQRHLRALEAMGLIVCVDKRDHQTWIYEFSDPWKRLLGLSPSEPESHAVDDKTMPKVKVKRSKRITTPEEPKVESNVIELEKLLEESIIPDKALEIVEDENEQPQRKNAPLDTWDVLKRYLEYHVANTKFMTAPFFYKMFKGWVRSEYLRRPSKEPKQSHWRRSREPRVSQLQEWQDKGNEYMQRHYGESVEYDEHNRQNIDAYAGLLT